MDAFSACLDDILQVLDQKLENKMARNSRKISTYAGEYTKSRYTAEQISLAMKQIQGFAQATIGLREDFLMLVKDSKKEQDKVRHRYTAPPSNAL